MEFLELAVRGSSFIISGVFLGISIETRDYFYLAISFYFLFLTR